MLTSQQDRCAGVPVLFYKDMKNYLLNVILGVDQLCNALIGGWPDETISARCWRHRNQFGWKQMRWLLDNVLLRWDRFADMTHCEMAYYNELTDAHKPKVYRSV